MPPVPSSFAELSTLSLEQLQRLLRDPTALEDLVMAQEQLVVFGALAVSQREEALRLAQENTHAESSISSLREEAESAAGAVESRARDVAGLLAQQQAQLDRFSASRLARDLLTTATALDASSEELAASLTDPDAPPLGSGGAPFSDSSTSVSGGGVGDRDGTSTNTPNGASSSAVGAAAGGASSTATGAALREFREAYVALRSRHHAATIKAEVLSQAGLAAVPVQR